MSVQLNSTFTTFMQDRTANIHLLFGGYGSSKSWHTAAKVVIMCLEDGRRKGLAIRATKNSLRRSVRDDIVNAAKILGVSDLVTPIDSRSEIHFANGAVIVMAGLDDISKIKSVQGVNFAWAEEGEFYSEAQLFEIISRLRDRTFDYRPLFISCNPKDYSSPIYTYFFENAGIDPEYFYKEKEFFHRTKVELGLGETVDLVTHYHHSTIFDNAFLDPINRAIYINIKDPNLRETRLLGRFGFKSDRVFHNITPVKYADVKHNILKIPRRYRVAGLDLGFQTSRDSYTEIAFDVNNQDLYIYTEHTMGQAKTEELLEGIKDVKSPWISKIYVDSASPRTIEDLKSGVGTTKGIPVLPVKKGTILDRMKILRGLNNIYICEDRCPETLTEFKSCSFQEDAKGLLIEDKFTGQSKGDLDLIDSANYALISVFEPYKGMTIKKGLVGMF